MLNKSHRGWLSLLLAAPVLLSIALGGPRPIPVAAQGALVAVEPADQAVDPGATVTVDVTIENVTDFVAYQFDVTFDPSVVEISEVEDGGFLGETGRNVVPVGPDIDNEIGTMSFGAITVGEASGSEGEGNVAVITLRAVGEGVTTLNLRNVQIRDTVGEIGATVEDGRVQVGSSVEPTDTPTEVPPVTSSSTPTGQAPAPTATVTPTPAEGATDTPPAAVTRTPTEPGTIVPTATETPANGETTVPTATVKPAEPEETVPIVTETPANGETTVPTATKAPTEPEATVSTATETPADGATVPAASPQATLVVERATEQVSPTLERTGEETDTPPPERRASRQPWLIGGAAALGLLGLVLVVGGVYLFGFEKQNGEQPPSHEEV